MRMSSDCKMLVYLEKYSRVLNVAKEGLRSGCRAKSHSLI